MFKVPKIIGFAEMSYEASNPYNTFFLERVAAEKGYGLLLHDIMMSIADKNGKPLAPDRYSNSSFEKNVWNYYFNKRQDISHLPIDDEKHPLTKDSKDDGKVFYHLKGDDISKRNSIDYVYWIDKPINYSILSKNHSSWIESSQMSNLDFKQLMHQNGEHFFHEMYGKNY